MLRPESSISRISVGHSFERLLDQNSEAQCRSKRSLTRELVMFVVIYYRNGSIDALISLFLDDLYENQPIRTLNMIG